MFLSVRGWNLRRETSSHQIVGHQAVGVFVAMAVNTMTWSDGAGPKPVVFVIGIADQFIGLGFGVCIGAGEFVQRRVVVFCLGVVVQLDEAVRVSSPGGDREEGLVLQCDGRRRGRDEDVTSCSLRGVQHVLRPFDVDPEVRRERVRVTVPGVDVSGRVEHGEWQTRNFRRPWLREDVLH